MRQTIWSVLVVAVMIAGSSKTRGQDPGAVQTPEKRESTCHLEFSINELEDGKKLNVRHYTMNLTGGNTKELKIGTRGPIETESGKFQYIDVGTNIRAHIYGKEDALVLDVSVEVSNFANPEQSTRGAGQPLLRQMVISGTPLIIFDKPTIVGSVDDPNSKREYQLEVTATKLR